MRRTAKCEWRTDRHNPGAEAEFVVTRHIQEARQILGGECLTATIRLAASS